MLDSEEPAEESPVLKKMTENCGRHFIIAESGDKAFDDCYILLCKLDELYSAVEITCKNAQAFCFQSYPLLDMARNSYQIH